MLVTLSGRIGDHLLHVTYVIEYVTNEYKEPILNCLFKSLHIFITITQSYRSKEAIQDSYIRVKQAGFKPYFHSIIISPPPAKNYDSKIIFSHLFTAKETHSLVVENLQLFFHI